MSGQWVRSGHPIRQVKFGALVTTAFEDLCSFSEIKALIIDTKAWHENANANLRSLKHDVGQCITESASYEKTMWERIEMELEEINVENLGFNHPICSEQNHEIMEACKEFIQNEESKINMDEVLESMLKVWKSPKYEAYIKKGKSINEGSYVCEVLAPLLNIVINDLPENLIAWDIWVKKKVQLVPYEKVLTGRPNSSQDKRVRDHKKLIRFSKDSINTTRSILKLKRIFNQLLKRQNLSIFTINIAGDVLELYAMRKESDPVPLESISKKSERIESYLRCTLEVYENSLNKKKHNWSQTNVTTWPEALKHDYEEENNRQVMNELKEYREWITANKKMRYEIKNLKMQVLEAEKELASMKMSFRRSHPRQRRTYEEHKAELEEENYHLRSELQAEVDSNCQNEKQIRALERECVRCEQEI
ncbi:hypothetical protein GLOIN_2v1787252 [Rhizophagus irregularis DAOM 181602=DAOM 197198]|uniref:Uncharacterized protein n=1 Tax=Rhizophagus irregularis (strain DAOM 181602 / DAOM 197198 / MUCL 43194) TaxID=747089 RepID=A0A2P4P693_RHIID|nr:hypothetical protein GLOIN_2v1787252 [Rhizophagus irregularis DAOM 181602=DAOM 197198]POG60916.1 hypothetical protein GLOIN_2v1787252 [Rhizophagus irregularis DAOM 181602=DAOM 197198]GET57732.1 hypothetical protein GLOIN_2v1787252 [Rhizophagus irregularis DAOM 181602=DAOM 197198]|eukprot:XP_025167782.1 hypothetical protein GLOIN_2v1787252 [Rhizophagus irregularis DAOM 181602=DAOM 197198]